MEKLGKSYKGQDNYPIRTAEDVEADRAAQVPYDKPDAVSLDVFFNLRGHRDPTLRAAMQAFTVVKRATLADWDTIFERF